MFNPKKINTVEELNELIGVSRGKLIYLANNSKKYYRIKKELINGKKRILYIANGDLKKVQKSIYNNILIKIPLPHALMGCRKGSSIKENAKIHMNNKGYIVNLDIKDFFPSINSRRVKELFQSIGFSKKASCILTELVTQAGAVPQGVCTSSYIAHLTILRLYKRLKRLCDIHGFKCSFYMDDITISGSKKIRNFVNLFSEIINQEGFEERIEKRKISTQEDRQEVNKIVINSGSTNVSKQKRRLLRAKINNLRRLSPINMDGNKNRKIMNSLLGEIKYVESVNKRAGKKLLEDYSKISCC